MQALANLHGHKMVAIESANDLSVVDLDEIDVVVLDYALPGGVTGGEIAKRIHSTHPRIPIAIFTAQPLSFFEDRPHDLPDDVDIIPKGAGLYEIIEWMDMIE